MLRFYTVIYWRGARRFFFQHFWGGPSSIILAYFTFRKALLRWSQERHGSMNIQTFIWHCNYKVINKWMIYRAFFSRGLQYYWCGNLAFERGERMWFISVKIAPHYHNIINPEQGQPHLTLLGRITTAVSHFILNHFMLYSLVRQCRKSPCRPAQEKFCWTLKLFDGICLYCPNFRDRFYIQGTFYFLGPYWSLLVCNVF